MMTVSARGGHAVTQCKREIVCLMEANMPIIVAAPKGSARDRGRGDAQVR